MCAFLHCTDVANIFYRAQMPIRAKSNPVLVHPIKHLSLGHLTVALRLYRQNGCDVDNEFLKSKIIQLIMNTQLQLRLEV